MLDITLSHCWIPIFFKSFCWYYYIGSTGLNSRDRHVKETLHYCWLKTLLHPFWLFIQVTDNHSNILINLYKYIFSLFWIKSIVMFHRKEFVKVTRNVGKWPLAFECNIKSYSINQSISQYNIENGNSVVAQYFNLGSKKCAVSMVLIFFIFLLHFF